MYSEIIEINPNKREHNLKKRKKNRIEKNSYYGHKLTHSIKIVFRKCSIEKVLIPNVMQLLFP